ncbi:hypothetical protein, partial [Acinetobacter baumannii]|uniref:hypothetical protein n=1 Tax=Acinetobacter baumannii TaxID=470 RepID=UPI001488D44E
GGDRVGERAAPRRSAAGEWPAQAGGAGSAAKRAAFPGLCRDRLRLALGDRAGPRFHPCIGAVE